ncbi:MAG: membrane-bound lytic murein transglycosylase MltF [Epsilonproteobacteria bacterium]|nr:membrane-bound lytic murein transglycosylase MltF [Campylobacterota bacterium]OIO14118.1 MAG: lytic transglycosylase F [Helicobacteraceae bacterium CG1_02_36_14]PIP09699.1 MAG: membrane-bound lytic murein transglycosylase MltF [Sulfurimonas sp. CG23_combo_of_CG06-09_8_20_14_all_36_33]PIS26244.1 MAG: membrane-bound lytic murein transglycosylase MltF [Sulfurimonas sp. CG08_land_8_20_14_0_20_36_33]PIU34328.1 MAG: membrane-bound lytic murein transglycosylase MltF [Sulfurimonas sp. CG07_land_8_20
MDKYIKYVLVAFFALSFFLFGWFSHSAYSPIHKLKTTTILDKIKANRTLNVVLLNAPSTYYIGAEGPQGFEYDLLHNYAKHLGVDLNITHANTIKEAIELSKNPNIHITSASLSKTAERDKIFNFGPSYFEVQEQVVCHRGMLNSGKFPRDIEHLAGLNIMVGEDTSYSQTIKSLQLDGYDINASFTSEYSTEELLEKVASNEIDCTIADSNIYALNLRYFTEMRLAFTISEREQLAWVLAPDSKELEADMYAWLNTFNQSGGLAQLKDHYYSYVLFFDYYNTKMFYKRIKSRLPKYKQDFIDISAHYEIPWSLLAAISYQESHWNPKAKSFTGVRGMMMLTRNTAKLLGVKNRLDPKQSIDGGARHLTNLMKLVPQEVQKENRLKFALAAYNIGLGHVMDAQRLAKKMGYNENIWSDLKKVLPLLAQKKYYKTLKYGYARGIEPVRYVESIYDFKNILENISEENRITEEE